MAEKTRVLVVDDEPQIVRALTLNLHALGYEVSSASSGEEALVQASKHLPEAVILDLGLPGIDGIEVIRGLRGWTDIPILVLSVREDEREKITALEAGADDYVTKPFGMGELVARLRAALRRAVNSDRSVPLIETSAFVIDLGAKRVTRPGGDEIRLTPTEWGIVETLASNEGKLVSQVQLLKDVWGPTYGEETNYLRVFMAQIRRKLEPDPASPRYFKTEPGMGYRFDNEIDSARGSMPPPKGPGV